VSPDHQWVAAAALTGERGIQVWDARTGRAEQFLRDERHVVTFSPDGKWLVGVGVTGYRLWKVGSWEPGPVVSWDQRLNWAGPAGFRPDGQLLAVPRSLRHIQLVDFARLNEVATLQAADPACVHRPCFSPDGLLLAAATESHGVHLWDLGAVGRQLRALGLGSDLLPERRRQVSRSPRVRAFQEVYEAECLPVDASHTAWGTSVDDTRRWGRDHSNDRRLHCSTLKGGSVELTVDVPETGRYRLAVCISRSWCYALTEVSLDGRKIGGTFDGFQGPNGPTEKVEYGTFELCEGPHRLRFKAVDKNPKSEGYYMGIDYVQLTPADR
jgi:WD domain, G-beta repeat